MITELITLSVVIPVYNEETRIGKTLEKISLYLETCKYTYEIIAVNDGSCDKTSDIIKGFANRYEKVRLIESRKNQGKGFSVRKGMLASSGQYVLFSGADLSTPTEEI